MAAGEVNQVLTCPMMIRAAVRQWNYGLKAFDEARMP